MIDIHNHTLFGVDDGPKEMKLSLEMLHYAEEQGVTDIILTPHYRRRMFSYDREAIDHNLSELMRRAEDEDIHINLYLGCEIHYHEDMLESIHRGRVRTMAGSDYVLTEYSYEDDYDTIREMSHRLVSAGYHPIIAHVERIGCLRKKPKLCAELQEEGALIQCNAQAIIGNEGFGPAHFTAKLLKNEWIDLVGSDTHNMTDRPNTLREAWEKIGKKYGEDTAYELLERNPGRILKSRRH